MNQTSGTHKTRNSQPVNKATSSVRRSTRLGPPLAARTRSKTRIAVYNDVTSAEPSTPDTSTQRPKRKVSGGGGTNRQTLGEMPMNMNFGEPLRMGGIGKRKAVDSDERPMKMARRDMDDIHTRIRSPLKTKTSTPKRIAKFFSALTPGKRHKSHTPIPTPARILLSPKKRPTTTPGPAPVHEDGPTTSKDVHMNEDEDEDDDNDDHGYIPRPPTPPRPHIHSASPAAFHRSSPPRLKHIVPSSPLHDDLFSPKRDPNSDPWQELDRRVIARLSFSPMMGSSPKKDTQPARVSVPPASPTPKVIEEATETLHTTSAASPARKAEDAPAGSVPAQASTPAPPAITTKAPNQDQVPKPAVTTLSDLPPSRLPSLSRLPRSSAPPGPTPRVSSEPTKGVVRGSMPPPSAFAASRVSSSMGRGFPSVTSSAPLPATSSKPSDPGIRKPSYPTSLGSGLPSRPPSNSAGSTTKSILRPSGASDNISGLPPSSIPRLTIAPRTVSEPVTRAPLSDTTRLTASTSNATTTREGISAETSESLAGLSNALNRLKTKRAVSINVPARRPTSMIAPTSDFMPSEANSEPASRSTAVRVASIHRPRGSMLDPHSGDESIISNGDEAGDRSLAALMVSSEGKGCMKGVVAFVDVRTAEGDEAGVIFADILRSLGARVISRLTDNVTHVIYKSGRQTTLTWWRRQEEDDRPFIVGISWVTKSKEKGQKLDELAHAVNVEDDDVFQKRRKSMEPRMLSGGNVRKTVLGSADQTLNLDPKRRSMINAPRIGSPLKKI